MIQLSKEITEVEDLGMFTENGLSWDSHIDLITSRANRMLGSLVKKTCKDFKDETTVKTLNFSRVRSNLEYSVVWCPIHQEKRIQIRNNSA